MKSQDIKNKSNKDIAKKIISNIKIDIDLVAELKGSKDVEDIIKLVKKGLV